MAARETAAKAADNAEMLIRKGVELRRTGRDKQAADLFREAYELSHTPRAAAQLGLCEQALGQMLEAEQHLSEALVAQSDRWIASKRSTLENSRASVRAKLGSLRVEGSPQGAVVMHGDRMLGEVPFAENVWVLPGPAELVVRANGFDTKSVDVTLTAGETKVVAVTLTAPGSPASTGRSGADSAAPHAESVAVNDYQPPPETRPSSWRNYATWGAVGAGVLSLGFGVMGHVKRESGITDFNQPSGPCFVETGSVMGGEACESLDSKISSSTTLMTVGYVGAAVFAGIGAVLWLTKPAQQHSSMACGVTPGSGHGESLIGSGLFQCNGVF